MENHIKSLELFYFDDCPSWKESLRNLKDALKHFDMADEIKLVKVETHEDAVLHQFPGSPTIKINGYDIFPTNQDNYALGCRIYKTPEGFKGSPTREMIIEKLLRDKS